MKKLLHERLRDITEPESIYVDGVEFYLYQAPAEALADEIEKYYIPRPRFEDGEPVQFGDTIGGCEGICNAITLFSSGEVNLITDNESSILVIFDGELVKRPYPKVIDADGVEIEPDSLKKLLDDMRSFGEIGADCTSDCCLLYADRLSVLIKKVG